MISYRISGNFRSTVRDPSYAQILHTCGREDILPTGDPEGSLLDQIKVGPYFVQEHQIMDPEQMLQQRIGE